MWACHLKLDEKIESVLGPGQGREGRGSGSGSGGQGYGEDTLSKYRCSQRQGAGCSQHQHISRAHSKHHQLLREPCRRRTIATKQIKTLHAYFGLLRWNQL